MYIERKLKLPFMSNFLAFNPPGHVESEADSSMKLTC